MAIEKQRRAKVKTKRREKTRGDEPTKEEYAVAKYVRFNCATKKATIMGDELPYFTACKALDCLMSSKFAGDGEKKIFSNRHACVAYMQILLDKGLFFRAKKLVPKSTKDVKQLVAEAKEQQKTEENAAQTAKKKKKSPEEENSTKKPDEKDQEGSSGNSGKKRSKKIKFDLHQNQTFNDGNDIYVWRYDPTSTKMFFLGLAMVFGAIGVCLFPLWPHEVRLGVYYLSIAAMVFVGLIILLVIMRSVLFALVWLFTFGKHHFWLLPHLTDDCGFFESFKPLYTHTVMTSSKDKAKEAKDSDCKVSDDEIDEKAEEGAQNDDSSDNESSSAIEVEEKDPSAKKDE